MANKTENYGLEKPEANEYYDIEVFNRNADIIDGQMKSIDNKFENITADGVGAAPKDHGHAYSEITGKPKDFPPSSHGHTPSQVGLGNVQNYGIATDAEAQAGVVNSKYMTPLRTREAITRQVGDMMNKVYRVSNSLLFDSGNIVGSSNDALPSQVIGQFMPKYDGVLKLVISFGNVSPAWVAQTTSNPSISIINTNNSRTPIQVSSGNANSVNTVISNAELAKGTRIRMTDLEMNVADIGGVKVRGISFKPESDKYAGIKEVSMFIYVKKGAVLTLLLTLGSDLHFKPYKFNTVNFKLYGSAMDI